MRIGVVGWEMEGRSTGVGRVLEGLLGGLEEAAPPSWTWRILLRGTADGADGRVPTDPRFEVSADGRPEGSPIRWEQLRLPRILRRDPPDLLYSPGYSLPLASGVPGVFTLHDLSFEHRGEDWRFRERWRRRLLARWSARRARRVLADTRAGAAEIESLYRVPRSKIGVVPLGVADRFMADDGPLPAAGLRQLGLGDGPYLLHLGSILPRRHVTEIVAAFARLAASHPDLRLVLAGADHLPRRGELERTIAASGVGERILRLGWVDDRWVPALYRGALASLYLSDYEGYGLPPLESLASGTPALVGPGLALDELWPDYPLRLPREALGDPEAIAGALERLLAAPDERRSLAAKGRELGRGQSWTASARALCRELEAAPR